MNHNLIFLDSSPQSPIYLSQLNPESLIIFVHGFAGHPIKTWGSFRDIVLDYPDYAKSDIIFYQYNSTGLHMAASALALYEFLHKCITASPELGGLRNGSDKTYRKIIIVAHSLGALVTRQTLLYANNAGDKWINRCRMLFFAPAHKGARIIELAVKCLPARYAGMALIAQWIMPVLGDLKEESPPIKEVMNRTESLLKQKKGNFTKAYVTVHAIHDKTIIGGLYCGDPTPKADLEHDHITVCKLKIPYFDKPLEYLKYTLTNE